MYLWQQSFIIVFAIISALVSVKGFYESHNKKNAYGETMLFRLAGIYVWGDAVVFGGFWALTAIATYLLQDWILFWLIFSLFWVVRSFGETIYWFNQQFSEAIREKPDKHKFLYKYFHNNSVWFIHQILQQCITVVSLVFSIYFAHLWLGTL